MTSAIQTCITLTRATSLGYSGAGFAAPHPYTIGIYKPMAAGDSGYFIITVNVAPAATDGKTIRVTGSTTPVVFGYSTSVNLTNSQNSVQSLVGGLYQVTILSKDQAVLFTGKIRVMH